MKFFKVLVDKFTILSLHQTFDMYYIGLLGVLNNVLFDTGNQKMEINIVIENITNTHQTCQNILSW